MLTIIQALFFFGTLFFLAYHRSSRFIWIPVTALVLSVVTYYFHWSVAYLLILWLFFLFSAVFFSVYPLRSKLFTHAVLLFFQRTLPSMSKTEREALEAGDVWWESELFCGRPRWQKLLSMPTPGLSPEEQAFVDHQVETLCGMLDDWKIVQEDFDISPEVWAYIKKERFLGIVIPKEYGGLGFSALAHSTIISKIATRSITAAVDIMVPNSLGPGELLQHYGTPEQKKHYLPRLAVGKEIPCFALTAPNAGSDASAITDAGIVCRGEFGGKEVIGIRLTWDKRYITLAPIATLLGLAFKLYDPEHLLGAQTDIGITLCLIPTSHPGVEIGHRHCPLGVAFLNGPTRGKDVFIPLDWIIGGVEMAGQGWRMLMECLSIGRAISLPALSTAGAKLCYRTSGAYARLRKQFKLSIGAFEGIEEALGRIGAHTYLLEATRFLTADAVDQKLRPAVASAIAKYHMTEILRQSINDAMDIHAGRGIQLGPRNYLGITYFSVPVAITVEGANILTRNLIIFGQGAMRCHPYLRAEIAAATEKNNVHSLKKFDSLLLAHMGYSVSNFVRCLFMGLTNGRFISAPVKDSLANYYRQLTRMSSALALVTDVAMLLLGGSLKRRERLSARLGDVLSHLYLASAVLKYFSDQQKRGAHLEIEVIYVSWCLQSALHQIETAFTEFFANFPLRWVGRALQFLIFPFGRTYRSPSDHLSHQIARSMMQTSEFRDRLTQACYVSPNDDDAVGRIEQAFALNLAAEPLEMKLHRAEKNNELPLAQTMEERCSAAVRFGILTSEEAQQLLHAEAARLDSMQVDEFPFDYFVRTPLHDIH